GVTCTVPPVACAADPTPSRVMGTWSATWELQAQLPCTVQLHLSGSDQRLQGAWTTTTTNCTFSTGTVSGSFDGARLRLNFSKENNSWFLVDATLATDSKTASGTVVGSLPNGSATALNPVSLSML